MLAGGPWWRVGMPDAVSAAEHRVAKYICRQPHSLASTRCLSLSFKPRGGVQLPNQVSISGRCAVAWRPNAAPRAPRSRAAAAQSRFAGASAEAPVTAALALAPAPTLSLFSASAI